MKNLRFSVSHRTKGGTHAGAVAHVRYITRAQQDAAAHVGYVTRTRQHVKEDLVATGTGNLPQWAEGDPAVFFAAAEQWERLRGRTATQVTAALPRELAHGQQVQAVEAFVASQLGTRHAYVWGIHEVTASDGKPQPHLHLAFSERADTGMGLGASQYFRQSGYQKNRTFSDQGWVGRARQAWSDTLNVSLEAAGSPERVDARSFRDQGIAATPAQYIPRKAWQRHPEGRVGREVTPDTPEMRASRAAAWEARKQELGLTPGMRQAETVRRIGEASRERGQPAQRVTADVVHTRLEVIQGRLLDVQRMRQQEVQYVQHPRETRSMEHLVAVQRVLEGEDEGASWSRLRPRREHDRDDIRHRGRGRSR